MEADGFADLRLRLESPKLHVGTDAELYLDSPLLAAHPLGGDESRQVPQQYVAL